MEQLQVQQSENTPRETHFQHRAIACIALIAAAFQTTSVLAQEASDIAMHHQGLEAISGI